MKYTLTIVCLFICANSIAQQYPIQQNLGSSSTIVNVPANGAVQAVLVPRFFTDTSSANAVPFVKFQAGAIIRTIDNKVWVRNQTANQWVEIATGASGSFWSLTGNTGTSEASNFLGTVDNQPLVFRTNNTERLRLTNTYTMFESTAPTAGIFIKADPNNLIRPKIFSGEDTSDGGVEGSIAFATGTNPVFQIDAGDNNKFLISSLDDTIVINQKDGLFSIRPLQSTSDTAYKFLLRNPTDGQVFAGNSLGQFYPNWQQTLIKSSVLNQENTINVSGNDFIWHGIDTMRFNGTGMSNRSVVVFDSSLNVYRGDGLSTETTISIIPGHTMVFQGALNNASSISVKPSLVGGFFAFTDATAIQESYISFVQGNDVYGSVGFNSSGNPESYLKATGGARLVLDDDSIGSDFRIANYYSASNGDVLSLIDNTTGEVGWTTPSGGGGVTTLAAIGASPNANGATISGTTLNLEPASGSFGGVVTTGTQTFAGAKTFSSNPTFSAMTAGRIIYTGTGGLASSSGNFQWDESGRTMTLTAGGLNQSAKIFTGADNEGLVINTNSTTSLGPGIEMWGRTSGFSGMYIKAGDGTGEDIVFRKGDGTGTQIGIITYTGRWGVGATAPTASFHLPAGTATANTAPLKFTSGTNLTTAEAGALEYDGTDLFETNSTAERGTVIVMRSQTSSAGTLSLAYTYTDYVFSGTTSTWTLPAVSATNHTFFLKNAGSGTVTINSNAGGNDIYSTSAVNTYALTAGSAIILRSVGSVFYVE